MDNGNYMIVDIGDGCYVRRNICNDSNTSNVDINHSFSHDSKAMILETKDDE